MSEGRKSLLSSKRKRRKLIYRPWYWFALAIPTRVARSLPGGIRTFIFRRAVRGI